MSGNERSNDWPCWVYEDRFWLISFEATAIAARGATTKLLVAAVCGTRTYAYIGTRKRCGACALEDPHEAVEELYPLYLVCLDGTRRAAASETYINELGTSLGNLVASAET